MSEIINRGAVSEGGILCCMEQMLLIHCSSHRQVPSSRFLSAALVMACSLSLNTGGIEQPSVLRLSSPHYNVIQHSRLTKPLWRLLGGPQCTGHTHVLNIHDRSQSSRLLTLNKGQRSCLFTLFLPPPDI